MAEPNTVFFLDDEEEDFGGFNDAPEKPPEEKEADPEKKPDDKPDSETPDGGDEDSGDQKKADEKPENDSEDKKSGPDWTEAIALISKQTEQIDTLLSQNQALQKKIVNPEPEAKEPVKPQFSQEDWDDDPEGCNEAMWNYRENLKAFNEAQERATKEKASSETAASLKAQHELDWKEELAENPVLTDPQIQNVWAEIFYKGGYSSKPDGVIRATRELKRQAKLKGVDLSSFNQKPVDDPPKKTIDPEEATRKGAEDEAARQKRVKAGAMHSGGKGGGQEKVTLTPEDRMACERIGCSPEAYIKTLEAMGGRK